MPSLLSFYQILLYQYKLFPDYLQILLIPADCQARHVCCNAPVHAKNSCYGVCGCLLTSQMFVIVSHNSSVSSFVLVYAAWRNQYGSHHSQRSACGGDHITHNITIIVLACPDKSALSFHDTGNSIIDQCVEILDTSCLEFFFVLCIINILENIFECMIVFFGNRIFCCKPEILLQIQCVVEAASCKTLNGFADIMLSLNDTCTCKVVYKFSYLCSVLSSINQFNFSRSRIFISEALYTSP